MTQVGAWRGAAAVCWTQSVTASRGCRCVGRGGAVRSTTAPATSCSPTELAYRLGALSEASGGDAIASALHESAKEPRSPGHQMKRKGRGHLPPR